MRLGAGWSMSTGMLFPARWVADMDHEDPPETLEEFEVDDHLHPIDGYCPSAGSAPDLSAQPEAVV